MNGLTDGQKIAVMRLLSPHSRGDKAARNFILSKLVGRPIESVAELEHEDWVEIREEAFPDWRNDDWTVGDDFTRRVAGYLNEYKEDVLGQRRLF